MIALTEDRLTDPLHTDEGSVASRFPFQLHAHRRDIDLFGRLFSSWSCCQRRSANDVDQALDAIDEQLARLEQTVTMKAVT